MRFIQLNMYLSMCLSVSICVCVCVPVAIYYFGLSGFIDKIEGTVFRYMYLIIKRNVVIKATSWLLLIPSGEAMGIQF
jgi:hypothetical protein